MTDRRLVVFLAAVAMASCACGDDALWMPPTAAGWAFRGGEVIRTVRQNFFDEKTARAWADRYAGYGVRATSEEQFVALTRQALADLKASHTGYYTPLDQRYYGLLAVFEAHLKTGPVEWDSIGADFTADHFVRTIFACGPADQVGLKRGDRILKADGADFQPVLSFQGRAGRPVMLTVERTRAETPLKIAVTPRRIRLRVEWLDAERRGARVVVHRGKRIAYVPFFSGAGDEYRDALQELLAGALRDADALVLDLRDGFGGCNPNLVNLFNKTPAVLSFVGRDGKGGSMDSQWRKPLVLIINGGTPSGKEVVAYSVKKHRMGTLVGTRTAGAVLAGSCFQLGNKAIMYLAVSDVRADGERIEGRGVDPDVEVADSLPYAGGADPQLDKALDIAAK